MKAKVNRDIVSGATGYSGFNTRDELGKSGISTDIYFSTYQTNIDTETKDIYNAILSKHIGNASNDLSTTLWIRLDEVTVDLNNTPSEDSEVTDKRNAVAKMARTPDSVETSGDADQIAATYGIRNLKFEKHIIVSNPAAYLYRYENGMLEAVFYCMYDNKINFSLFKRCLNSLSAMFEENKVEYIDRVFIPAICKNYQKLNDKDTVVFEGVAAEVYGLFVNMVNRSSRRLFSNSYTYIGVPRRIDIINIFKEKKEVPQAPKAAPKKKKLSVSVNDSYKKNYNKGNYSGKPSYNKNNNGYKKFDNKKPYNRNQNGSSGSYSSRPGSGYRKPYNGGTSNGNSRYGTNVSNGNYSSKYNK